MTDFREIEEAQERLSALKSLTTSQGWEILKEILGNQIEVRRNLEDAKEIEDFYKDVLDLAKLKAERRALALVLALPDTLIEQLEEDLEDLYQQETIEDAPGNADEF